MPTATTKDADVRAGARTHLPAVDTARGMAAAALQGPLGRGGVRGGLVRRAMAPACRVYRLPRTSTRAAPGSRHS